MTGDKGGQVRLCRKGLHPMTPDNIGNDNRCRGCEAERHRQYRADHPDYAKREAERIRRLRGRAFDHYGRSCACCGESRWQFLTLDHTEGDGAAWRREQFGRNRATASMTYRRLRTLGYPPGFQTMCSSCNFGRHWNGGVCPHIDGGATYLAGREASRRVHLDWLLRLEMIAAYGGQCSCPGCKPEVLPMLLAIDHIANDGADHRRQLGSKTNAGGARVWRWLRDQGWPDTMQLMCFNCNDGRHWNGGTCPHLTPPAG